jgi:Chlorophyll A-B binding protein
VKAAIVMSPKIILFSAAALLGVASLVTAGSGASAFVTPPGTGGTVVVPSCKFSGTAPSALNAQKAQVKAMSKSLPFLERPASLDGTMAGDVGFDPFGFAKSKEDLELFREAELKHARLAMLVREQP